MTVCCRVQVLLGIEPVESSEEATGRFNLGRLNLGRLNLGRLAGRLVRRFVRRLGALHVVCEVSLAPLQIQSGELLANLAERQLVLERRAD